MTVLDLCCDIGKLSGVTRYGGTQRHWLPMVMDGLPYVLAHRLIRETKLCVSCGSSIFGDEPFSQHCVDLHAGVEDCELEFDWVVLKIGPGHF
jgi:hypothetical protein